MFLIVVKRSANWQFEAVKTITHPNQQLTYAFIKIFSKIAPSKNTFSKLLPQRIYFKKCF